MKVAILMIASIAMIIIGLFGIWGIALEIKKRMPQYEIYMKIAYIAAALVGLVLIWLTALLK